MPFACDWNPHDLLLAEEAAGFIGSANPRGLVPVPRTVLHLAKVQNPRRLSTGTMFIVACNMLPLSEKNTLRICSDADTRERRFKDVVTGHCHLAAGGESPSSAAMAQSMFWLACLAFTLRRMKRTMTVIGPLPVHLACSFPASHLTVVSEPTASAQMILRRRLGNTDGYPARAKHTGLAAERIVMWPDRCPGPCHTMQSGSLKGRLRRTCRRSGWARWWSVFQGSRFGFGHWRTLSSCCRMGDGLCWRLTPTGATIRPFMRRYGAWYGRAKRSVTRSR